VFSRNDSVQIFLSKARDSLRDPQSTSYRLIFPFWWHGMRLLLWVGAAIPFALAGF